MTSIEATFRPRRFYRSLATRLNRRKSFRFALLHWILASVLFGLAAFVHADDFSYFQPDNWVLTSPILGTLIFAIAAFLLLGFTTPIAARLTSWEAAYGDECEVV